MVEQAARLVRVCDNAACRAEIPLDGYYLTVNASTSPYRHTEADDVDFCSWACLAQFVTLSTPIPSDWRGLNAMSTKAEEKTDAKNDTAKNDTALAPINESAARGTGVPGAVYVEQEGDRTAKEKVKAISAAGNAAAKADPGNVALTEINDLRVLVHRIAEWAERSFNVDFLGEASLGDVLSGEAAARGAVSVYGEHPHLVDDQVVPAGMNNPTDEILPPNVLPGSDEAKELGFEDGNTRKLDR